MKIHNILMLFLLLTSTSTIAVENNISNSNSMCPNQSLAKNSLEELDGIKLISGHDIEYYGYENLKYIPLGEHNDIFNIVLEIDKKKFKTEQQVIDDYGEAAIVVSQYKIPNSKERLIVVSRVETPIDLPSDATQTYYYNRGERHYVYLYNGSKLDYLGKFKIERSNYKEYDELAKKIPFSDKQIDYLSTITVIKSGNKFTFYNKSKYVNNCTINTLTYNK